jgi:hypothetical protein
MPSPADSAIWTVPGPGEGLRDVGQRAGRDQHGGGLARVLGLPVELAHREPEAVGGGEREPAALDLQPDAGEHRQGVVAAGGHRHLRDGGGEDVAGDRCRPAAAWPAAAGSPRRAWSAG